MTENYHGVSVRSETTMTDDLKAPERIWVEMPDLFDGMGFWQEHESAKLVEYVRADRIATLEAALADMTQQRDRQYDMNVSLIAKQAQTEAERDAAMAGALSVRELAWEQLGERAWRAPSPLFGSFRVERYGDRLWQALWSVPGICDTFVEGDFATADDAKQAIQARIMSALTPDPDCLIALTAMAYEAAIADMTQQRDAAMAGAVKVKPLVWVKHPSVDIWRADTAFGTYKVFGLGPTPSWDFDSFSDLNDKTSKSAESVTAAKAAAQADYNSRILSALTPDPDRMLALTAAAYEDAVSGLERDIEDREIDAARFRAGTNPHHYRMNLAQAIRYHAAQIRARIPANALAALSRIEAQAEARGMRKAADRAQEIADAAREHGHTLKMGSKAQNEIMERCWGAEDARMAIHTLADATEAAAKGGV